MLTVLLSHPGYGNLGAGGVGVGGLGAGGYGGGDNEHLVDGSLEHYIFSITANLFILTDIFSPWFHLGGYGGYGGGTGGFFPGAGQKAAKRGAAHDR